MNSSKESQEERNHPSLFFLDLDPVFGDFNFGNCSLETAVNLKNVGLSNQLKYRKPGTGRLMEAHWAMLSRDMQNASLKKLK